MRYPKITVGRLHLLPVASWIAVLLQRVNATRTDLLWGPTCIHSDPLVAVVSLLIWPFMSLTTFFAAPLPGCLPLVLSWECTPPLANTPRQHPSDSRSLAPRRC